MIKVTFAVFLILLSLKSFSQWESINPGAGGQVQDIVADPNRVGRLILASDMEGIYESLDNGESWHVKRNLHQNRVYSVAFSKGDANKLFLGTLYGLEVSNDGGKTFTLITKTKRKSIGAVAVNPNNKNIVVAGVGWSDDYDFSDTFGLLQNGKCELYRSFDSGQTWVLINLDTDIFSDRNIFNIQFDNKNSNNIYVGAAKGVFKSIDNGTSWDKIAAPSKTSKNKGIALSPDGKFIYAVYTTSGDNGFIYASPTSKISWQKLTNDLAKAPNQRDYWHPEVDPRSTGSEHKLIVGLQSSRDGLFEVGANWNGKKLVAANWKPIWQGTEGYDTGWDLAAPNPRFAHYTPMSWKRAIWSTTNQTIFEGKIAKDSYLWKNKYSIPNDKINVTQWNSALPAYSSRGTQSTYSYDIAVDSNYVIQGQADNGAMESWDYGKSWSNIQHRLSSPPLSDVQAVDIAVSEGVQIVIAQMTSGYGGNALNGSLYVKKLLHHSPKDKWLFLAGGANSKGAPSSVFGDVAVSPAKKDRVFAFSTGNGLWMMDDIGRAVSEAELGKSTQWIKITNGIADSVYSVKKIAPHPSNPNIVYINGTSGNNQGVFKGEKIGNEWVWKKLYEGSGWDSEIAIWENGGKLCLFFSGIQTSSDADKENFIGALSTDDGNNWKTVMTSEIAKNLKTNQWYDAVSDDFHFQNKGGIVGSKNQIIMNYYDHKFQKSYGIFKGTIYLNGMVTWEDFTGDLPFAGLTSAIIKKFRGVPYLFVTTAGAGAWRRPFYR